MRQRLGQDQRIKKKSDFDFIFKTARPIQGKILTLWIVAEENPLAGKKSQIAVIVSRGVDNRAVIRNIWKRRLREIFRKNQDKIKFGTRILAKVRLIKPVKTLLSSEIEKEFMSLIQKTGFSE